MRIRGFDPLMATPAHDGTCLSMPVLPEGMWAPFRHAWVSVPPHTEMVGHAHETPEIYLLMRGASSFVLGDEIRAFAPSEVVEITPNAYHAVRNDSDEESLWLVLYWDAAASDPTSADTAGVA